MIRMEDPDVDVDVDWEIDQYPSCSDYFEEEGGGKSKVKWMLEKSMCIGKKVVITGFVVSSASILLPSVIVVSALGFSVSVPFGVMFASYACTQTLMNKLLPIPTSYRMLEYEDEKDGEIEYFIMEKEEKEQMNDLKDRKEKRIDSGAGEKNEWRHRESYEGKDGMKHANMEEDEKEENEDLNEVVEKGIDLGMDEENEWRHREMYEGKDGIEYADMEEEEKEEMKDLKEGVEKRIELVENENELARENDNYDLQEQEERLANGDESLREEVYEEDVEDDIEESKDEVLFPEIRRIIVVVGGEKRINDDFGKSDGLVVIERTIEGEVPRGEKVIDDEEGGEKRINDDFGKSEALVVIASTIGGEITRDEKVIEDEEDGDMEKETVGLLEKITDEGKNGKSHVEEEDGLSNVAITKAPEKPIEEENAQPGTLVHVTENGFETGSLLEDCSKENLRKRRRTSEDNLGLVAEEVEPEPEPMPEIEMEDILVEMRVHGAENDHGIIEEKVMQQEQTGEGDDSDSSYLIMEHKEISICPNRVMRETAADENESPEVERSYEGNDGATEYILKESVDLSEIPITETRPESKPEQRDNSSQTDSEVPSEKESIIGEKKIWEQIDALRTIVGYRGTLKKSCIDEVKALYIFTGVESSFENTNDLDQLHHKLKFLMSIVGVK